MTTTDDNDKLTEKSNKKNLKDINITQKKNI